MSKVLYCWRCRADVPMLDEHEWRQVLPELTIGLRQIKHYRQAHEATLEEAKNETYGRGALARYRDITGFHETDPEVIWHHRLSLYGSPCEDCGKPLRTPRARMCAACGAPTKLR
jgi:hypothetical protein